MRGKKYEYLGEDEILKGLVHAMVMRAIYDTRSKNEMQKNSAINFLKSPFNELICDVINLDFNCLCDRDIEGIVLKTVNRGYGRVRSDKMKKYSTKDRR